MAEAEYREQAGRGAFLAEDEWRVLGAADDLLFPVVAKHWDLAACFCPCCEAWRAMQRALNARAAAYAATGAGI